MAKAGAKKQLQDNQGRLAMLRNLLIFANAWFILGRLILFRSGTSWSTYAAALVMSGLQFFCFNAVTRMAEPLMGPNGEILDGGADLLNASIASYYQDLIYLCAFVQISAVLTSYAWWAFWLVPLVAAWIIYTSIVQPYISHQKSASKEVIETEAERKRREKAERKAGRPKIRQAR